VMECTGGGGGGDSGSGSRLRLVLWRSTLCVLMQPEACRRRAPHTAPSFGQQWQKRVHSGLLTTTNTAEHSRSHSIERKPTSSSNTTGRMVARLRADVKPSAAQCSGNSLPPPPFPITDTNTALIMSRAVSSSVPARGCGWYHHALASSHGRPCLRRRDRSTPRSAG
jgi:hypothetical protein